MSGPRLPEYLTHIRDAITRIEGYVEGMEIDDLRASEIVQDAVIRNIEVIGEASNRIATRYPEFADAHTEFPFSSAYKMRNVVAHGYSRSTSTLSGERSRTIFRCLPVWCGSF